MAIKIFLDGASAADMRSTQSDGFAAGFTTNPTLMTKAGVAHYETFVKEVVGEIRDLPISFEVFADDFPTMREQARKIALFGDNVYVKIPVMNTKRESAVPLIRELSADGVKLNITAIFTEAQVRAVVDALAPDSPAVISVFAGRIADTGRDPIPVMRASVEIAKQKPLAEVLWASPREVLNIYQAEECGCHIITVPKDMLPKLSLKNKDLDEYARETVQMFYDDAVKSKFVL